MSVAATIVIPVRDHVALTRQCVEAILADPPAAPFELVVVDDGSRDATPAYLAGLGERVTVVRHAESTGFATACNAGAAAARRDAPALVFLNNDTVPQPGWLDALLTAAAEHPRAGVVGSRLLYPDGSVQHAGVVFGQDGWPRHLYAGLPGDHPAVLRERELQAVTAACMLVRHDAFTAAGGFDAGYRNGLEDVDLCLRLREGGWAVRYCPGSVVVHLESVTRGRRSPDRADGERRYRARWHDVVVRDDLQHFAADGLLRVGYSDAHPIALEVAPELAACRPAGGADATADALQALGRRAAGLLSDVVALTVALADRDAGPAAAPDPEDLPPAGASSALTPEVARRRLDALQGEVAELQRALGVRADAVAYRAMILGVQASVARSLPLDARVAVISRGDDELLALDGRVGLHFPQAADGAYAGHHPADSDAAIDALERLRADGATHLVVPAASAWWLEHYVEFAEHLARFATVAVASDCRIVDLTAPARRDEEVGSHA